MQYNNSIFSTKRFPKYEFHISKEVRKKYELSEELFSLNGNVVFANFSAVRNFVKNLNLKRNKEDQVLPGQVNACGLLDEIYHYIFRLYELQVNPGVFKKALTSLNSNIGEDTVRKLLFDFIAQFPPLEVYNGKISSFDYLNSYTEDRSNAEITLEEIILLYIANFNPANKKLIELFDQNYLSEKDSFLTVISTMDSFFQKEKKFGPMNQDIFTLFKTPIIKHPESLEDQLQFISEQYGILLDEKFIRKILSSKDLIKEDLVLTFTGFGDAPTAAPIYKGDSNLDFLTLGKSGYKYAQDSWKDFVEPENFTEDIDWMPKVVLLAKNSYVWLDQLSKKYQRPIKLLSQIPDEELDQLAKWNFNGLWLIGIWERSSASKKIKNIMGNTDAVSSAYSLYDYQIANDLGGEEAYHNLNYRCKIRGIRLASDMVPNHTGIFSKWVVENSQYFIQTNNPPFPNYSFTGPDLSDDSSMQIRIEDGYWRKSDAAVVFQRIDNGNGSISYLYHGNDGTNMPWNDTAQLNMLNKDVREAVIQKIFDVARKFSIIRFDAAMTLTKRHFARLWFPEPGKGGDIPSRADFSLTKEEFDNHFPEEFWREVVDRINRDMPETLLLAEAFWLLEGYFVRSLGMHRVYNSAFMHMMMKEENDKYRDLISNTLEFEPEILKRYVSFMSNPDEETAIKQFGIDDKYFGVCTLLVTLPGLPMFGHGQIEGYTEKYGMEYQRAYYHEIPNQWLIERHEREIFPLMKKRYLFSQVTNFWLYDFNNGYGIDENVFAFSNMERGERAIVFYNNKFQNTNGNINWSTPKLVSKNENNKQTISKTIAEALNINGADNCFYIFREHSTNLEYLMRGNEIWKNGFSIQLDAFKYKVFMDFREVFDSNGDYYSLENKLNGAGVPNINQSLLDMKLEPIYNSYSEIFSKKSVDKFINAIMIDELDKDKEKEALDFLENEYNEFLINIKSYFRQSFDPKAIIKGFEEELIAIHRLNEIMEESFNPKLHVKYANFNKCILISEEANYRENSIVFLIWLTLLSLKKSLPLTGELNSNNFIDESNLTKPIVNTLKKFGRGEHDIFMEVTLLNILLDYYQIIFTTVEENNERSVSERLLKVIRDPRTQKLLGVNEYEGVIYYSKENFEDMLNWMLTLAAIELVRTQKESVSLSNELIKMYTIANYLKKLSIESEYRFTQLISLMEKKAAE